MNFGIFLWILYIFLIHCNFMECQAGKDDGASPSAKTVEKTDKFPTHLMPPSLEWIFSLVEWVAKEWPNLAKQPNIVDEIPMIIGKMREKSLTFLPILKKVLNEVDNTETEITNGLEMIKARAETENEKQKRDKNDFRFSFMVDCIYAAHMDADGKIKFGEIAAKLHKPGTVDFVAYPTVETDPLHGIVTKNKCAEEEVIEAFFTLMRNRFCKQPLGQPDSRYMTTIDEYFFEILKEFRESGKDIIIGKKAAAAELYFPERLPKLHNLASLVNTLMRIVQAIFAKIRVPINNLASDGQIFAKRNSDVYDIFTSAIDDLTNIRQFIYFTIRNGTHYTKAFNQLANSEIKEKMHKIAYKYSFFVSNSNANIRPMYRGWDIQKNVHMIHHLAQNAFGFTQQQLDKFPKDKGDEEYFATLAKEIAKQIVGDFYSNMGKRDEFHGGKIVLELNALFFRQIRLNLFCVGVQEAMINRHEYKNYDAFQKDFRLRLMVLLEAENGTDGTETGYMKQVSQWAVGHSGLYFAPTDSGKANKILYEMGKKEHSNVKTWEVILLEGTKEMHEQICGSRKAEVPAVGGGV